MTAKLCLAAACSAFSFLFAPPAARVGQLPPPNPPPAEFVSVGQTMLKYYDSTTIECQSAGSAGGAATGTYRVYAYTVTDEGLWQNMLCWQTVPPDDTNYYWFGGAGYAGGTVTFSFASHISVNGYMGESVIYDGGCWLVYQLQKRGANNAWTTVKEAVTWMPLGPPPKQ